MPASSIGGGYGNQIRRLSGDPYRGDKVHIDNLGKHGRAFVFSTNRKDGHEFIIGGCFFSEAPSLFFDVNAFGSFILIYPFHGFA
jgi:hypothetical protein